MVYSLQPGIPETRVGSFGTKFVTSSQVPGAWVCLTCGSYVGDYIKHDKWHNSLALNTSITSLTPEEK